MTRLGPFLISYTIIWDYMATARYFLQGEKEKAVIGAGKERR